MKRIIQFLSFCSVVGAGACSAGLSLHTQEASGQNTLAAFDAARLRVEFHGGPVDVLVLGPGLDEDVRTVLRRLRGAIDVDQVPSSSTNSLPAKYFVLNAFRIGSDQGHLAGRLGPVPALGERVLACGTTFEVELDRRSGSWQAKVVRLIVC